MGRYLLDTSVAILLRDGDEAALGRATELGNDVAISVLTRIELEGGVARPERDAAIRRVSLDRFLSGTPCHELTTGDAAAYDRIVADIGYSRRKIIDRVIAAQALTRDATLVTLNRADFADVPGLQLEAWDLP